MSDHGLEMWTALRERVEKAMAELGLDTRVFDVAIPEAGSDEPIHLKAIFTVDVDKLLGVTEAAQDQAAVDAQFRQMMAEDREREEQEKIEAAAQAALERQERRKLGEGDEPDPEP